MALFEGAGFVCYDATAGAVHILLCIRAGLALCPLASRGATRHKGHPPAHTQPGGVERGMTVTHSELDLRHGTVVATQAADCPLVGAGEFDVHRAVPVKGQRDTRSSLHHRSLATAEHHQLTVQAQGQGHKLSIQLRQKRKENYMGAYRFNIFPLFTNPE